MRKQIRRGCFETNSSSMHSIVVKRSDVQGNPADSGPYIYKGRLRFWGSALEFGRSPFDILDTPIKKLRYAIAEKCGGWREANVADAIFEEEILPIIREIFPEVEEVVFDDLDDFEVIEGQKRAVTGRDYGWVDHQSQGMLARFLKNKGIDLKEFIIDPRYVIIVDGDEYGVWETLKESGLVDPGAIEEEYPQGNIPYDSFVYKEGNGAEVHA